MNQTVNLVCIWTGFYVPLHSMRRSNSWNSWRPVYTLCNSLPQWENVLCLIPRNSQIAFNAWTDKKRADSDVDTNYIPQRGGQSSVDDLWNKSRAQQEVWGWGRRTNWGGWRIIVTASAGNYNHRFQGWHERYEQQVDSKAAELHVRCRPSTEVRGRMCARNLRVEFPGADLRMCEHPVYLLSSQTAVFHFVLIPFLLLRCFCRC